MSWSLITNVYHVNNNFQRSFVVSQPLEEEGSGNTLQRCGSALGLDRCFLGFNIHVVKTISGALYCLFVSHEC